MSLPGCTGMYLGVAGHMLAFYGKKTNPRAGLLLDQAIIASKAIANIPTWMGYFAMWRVKCISTTEVREILVGCKRIEKESLRRACWELQQWFSALQVDPTLSATVQPFQPRVAPQSSQEDDVPRGRHKKKDGFSSKIQIPEFGGKKGHAHDVAGAFWQWAHCIMYYRDYYEGSYLMPLVVSSLTGDASDVFDWIHTLNPGNTQDLTTLLQMLREHYGGSLTFREQRNTRENLRQEPREAAIDFLIRVGTSVSNLGKDWKDELTDEELQSLQYEVSMNGVHEEIRHILDSKIAKNGGKLTPQQMYEAVKKYETYVACNKRLQGKGASSSTTQPKATGQTSGYKPRFHKTTAFAATVPEVGNDGMSCPESPPQEEADAYGHELSQEDDKGLYIPSYLEEAIPDDPVLQVKMAHAMQAQEVETRRCFTCNQPGHLQRDHWKYEEKNMNGPLQPKGPPQNKSAPEKAKAKMPPAGQNMSQTNLPR